MATTMDPWEEHRLEAIEDLKADLRNESASFWSYFLLIMLYGFATILVMWFADAWWLVFGLFMAAMTAVCFCCLVVTNNRMKELRERIGRLELGGAVRPLLRVDLTEPWPDPPEE